MRFFDAQQLSKLLDYGAPVGAFETAFRHGFNCPPRHHHTLHTEDAQDAPLLLMLAWDDTYLGIKTATVMSGYSRYGLRSVNANYQLLDRETGQLLAILNGTELTARRTAAASALASRYLSAAQASRLLMVGAGRLAPHLIRTHASQRKITEVQVWGRRRERSTSIAAATNSPSLIVKAVDDLEHAVAKADIISCATLTVTPLIYGEWLQACQHLNSWRLYA